MPEWSWSPQAGTTRWPALLAVLASLLPTAAAQPALVPLVKPGARWKYLDDGTNPGSSWRQPAYNDATWASGRAQLGYGDGDERTVVSFGANKNAKQNLALQPPAYLLARP